MSLQIKLFTALRNAKVDSEAAETVVKELESHIAMKIEEANAPLIERIDALNKEIGSVKWTISIALVIATVVITISNALN